MIDLTSYFNLLDEKMEKYGMIVITPGDNRAIHLRLEMIKLMINENISFENDDIEKLEKKVLSHLEQNYQKVVDYTFLIIFIDKKYKDLFHFIIKNKNYKKVICDLDDFVYRKEILEKHYIGKTFNELSKDERDFLKECSVQLYKGDIILNYNIGVSIKGQIVDDTIKPIVDEVFSYKFLLLNKKERDKKDDIRNKI